MSNFNKVILMGNLTKDPELRYTPQGIPVSELGLAVNREYKLQSGEKRKETLFIDVTVWRKQAELCCQYLRKGSPIFIEGRLTLDSWETQEGQKRTKIRVVADNFQFVGGGRGSSSPVPAEGAEAGGNGEPGVEGQEAAPPGDYGSSYRRGGTAGGDTTRGVAGGRGRPQATEGSTEEFAEPKEEDVPF